MEPFSPSNCLLVLGSLMQFIPILMINMYYMITSTNPIIHQVALFTFALTTVVYIFTQASFESSQSSKGCFMLMMHKHGIYNLLALSTSFMTFALIAGDLMSQNWILGTMLCLVTAFCSATYRT